jgi:hypothetical protein
MRQIKKNTFILSRENSLPYAKTDFSELIIRRVVIIIEITDVLDYAHRPVF